MCFLTAADVAARYQINKSTVWKYSREGQIPRGVKLADGTTRWYLEDLKASEAKKRQDAIKEAANDQC